MADEEHEEQQKSDKHNWGAADLEKVSSMNEDGRNVQMKFDKLINDHPAHPIKQIKLKKEDVTTIMDALEVSRVVAEKELIAHEGDAKAAIRSLIGF